MQTFINHVISAALLGILTSGWINFDVSQNFCLSTNIDKLYVVESSDDSHELSSLILVFKEAAKYCRSKMTINSLLASGADSLYKQFGPRLGPTECRKNVDLGLDSNPLRLLKDFFLKVNFEKSQQMTKALKITQAYKELSVKGKICFKNYFASFDFSSYPWQHI